MTAVYTIPNLTGQTITFEGITAILTAMAEASVEIDSVIYTRRQDYVVTVRLESGSSVSLPSVISFGPSRSD
jgi:hypothetical protein